MPRRIVSHRDLDVYQRAFSLACRIFEISKACPKEETYSLTDQMRRASRSVCSNIAEAWRKRIYEAAFIAKLNDAEGEAAESQVWIDFAVASGYVPTEMGTDLSREYDGVIASLVNMRNEPEVWVLPSGRKAQRC